MIPIDYKLDVRYHEKDLEKAFDLINSLKQVKGAKSYDGDASCQVLLPLTDGGYLRIGITDEDVAEIPYSLWVDRYKGLPIVGGKNLQTGELF